MVLARVTILKRIVAAKVRRNSGHVLGDHDRTRFEPVPDAEFVIDVTLTAG
jgi:hypothetical protein